MIRKQHVAMAGFQLALVGMLSCSSDPNVIIGAPTGGGAGAPAVAAGSGGESTAAGGMSVAAGGGDAAGAGVPGTSGGTSGTTGGTDGTGGVVAAGGSGGGTPMGMAGTGGMPGTGAICSPSGAQFDCGNVLKAADGVSMDGYANKDLAVGASEGSDAHQINCTNSEKAPTIYKEKHWQLSGANITAGKNYKVDLHFYGVVECKNYIGGSGPASNDSDVVSTTVSHNLWMTGAKDNGDHWNTYTFTVTPASSNRLVGIGTPQTDLPDLMKTYVINQCPKTAKADHYTFRIDFASSITVPANSFVNYVEYDTNCRMIANCGAADAGKSCNDPYNLVTTVTQAVPNTNALTLNQPLANNASPPSRGQWWLVDVTNITALP